MLSPRSAAAHLRPSCAEQPLARAGAGIEHPASTVPPTRRSTLPASLAIAFAFGLARPSAGQGYHQRHPNDYATTADDNTITALNRRLANGETVLASGGKSGRLRALLEALDIPVASQTLVFSKTSLQRHRISPQNPRALYFGRDAYVGWTPGAAALEVAASDPRLGLVFYTLAQDADTEAVLRRDDSCLSCHATSRTRDEPGLLLRSVFPDERGDPIASAGEVDVTHETPIAERWGGWFVTGSFVGSHRGNGIAHRDGDGAWRVRSRPARDLGAFAAEFAVADYPANTSDLGALMALEHQVTVHNLLIQSALHARWLLANDEALNNSLGESGLRESTARILDGLARKIAATLLLANEAPLDGLSTTEAPVAVAIQVHGPNGAGGLQLGQLDLRTRLFTLPLSPCIHSPAFAWLPPPLRQRVLQRLRLILERGRMPGGLTLSPAERSALHQHLAATVPGY